MRRKKGVHLDFTSTPVRLRRVFLRHGSPLRVANRYRYRYIQYTNAIKTENKAKCKTMQKEMIRRVASKGRPPSLALRDGIQPESCLQMIKSRLLSLYAREN